MSFTGGGANLGSARGTIELGADLRGIDQTITGLKKAEAQAKSSARAIAQQMRSIGDSMRTAGAVLSLAVTAPIVAATKTIVSAASDQAEALSAVQTVFGDNAKTVIEFADTAAVNLGLTETAALSTASALGALYQGVGITTDGMAEFTLQTEQAAADLASFYNVDPGEVLENLRSGLVGEAEPLRKFGILISAAATEAKAAELGFSGVYEELSEGEKVIARQALIMEGLGAAQGDFARTSGGLANQMRIVRAEVGDLAADLGQILLPQTLQLVGAARQGLAAFRGLSPPVQEFAVKVALVAAAAGPVLIVLGTMLSSLAKLGAVLGLLTGPLAIVIASVAALGVAWKQNWFGIRDLLSGVVDAIMATVGRMIQFFQAARERGLDPFALAFRTLIVTLSERLGGAHPVVDFLQELYRVLNKLGDAVKTQDWDAFFADLDTAGTRLRAWVSDQAGRARTFGAELLQTLIESLRGVNWDQVKNTIGAGIEGALAIRREIIASVLTFGGEIFQNIRASLEGVNWPVIGQTILDEIGSFTDWAKDRAATELTFGAEMLQNIIDGFTGLNWSAVGQAVRDGIAGVDWNQVGTDLKTRIDAAVTQARTFGATLLAALLTSLQGVNWDALGTNLRQGLDEALARVKGTESDLNTFGAELLANLLTSIQTTNWDAAGLEIRRRLGLGFAKIEFLTTEPQWQALWDDLIANTQAEISLLSQVGGWSNDAFVAADWNSGLATLRTKAIQFGHALWSNTMEELENISNIGKWVVEQFAASDFGKATQAAITEGENLAGAFLTGLNKKGVEIRLWASGLGGRIEQASGDMQDLVQKGSDLLAGFLQGAVDALVDVLIWFRALPTAIAKAVPDGLTALQDVGKNIIAGLWNGVVIRWNQFKTDFLNIWNGFWASIPIPDIPNPLDALTGGQKPVAGGAGGGAGGFAGGEAEFEQHGFDSAMGYATGLASAKRQVDEAGRELVRTADQAVKSEAIIASPSQLFGERGVESAQGYAQGIETGAAFARDAAEYLVEETVATLDEGREAINQLNDAYYDAVQGIVKARNQEIKKLDHDLVENTRDARARMIDIERSYAQQSRALNEQRRDLAISIENQLADLAAQRTERQAQAQEELAEAERQFYEQSRAAAQEQQELRRQAQQQAQEAARAWKQVNAENLAAQKELRKEMLATLKETRQAFRDAMEEIRRDIAQVSLDLKAALDDLDFQRGEQDFDLRAEGMGVDLARDLADNAREMARVQAELDRVLADPSASWQERVEAQFAAEQRLADLRLERQRIEEDAAAAQAALDLDRARAREDEARRRAELEAQAAADLTALEAQKAALIAAHAEEEKRIRQEARAEERALEQERKQAQQDFHRDKRLAEQETDKLVKAIQSGQRQAAKDLADAQIDIRDQLITDMQTFADAQIDIEEDARDQLAQIEKDKRLLARDTQRDRDLAVRDAARNENLILRAQEQANRQAAKDERAAKEQLDKELHGADLTDAGTRGGEIGTTTGQAIAEGERATAPEAESAGQALASATGEGIATVDLHQKGVDAANGFIRGIMDQRNAARIAGGLLAKAAEDGLTSEAEIASPSRRFRMLGRNSGGAFALGFLDSVPDAERAAREMVAATARMSASAASGRAASWQPIAGGVSADRARRASAILPAMPENLIATVVIRDDTMTEVILGTALAPLLAADQLVGEGGGW